MSEAPKHKYPRSPGDAPLASLPARLNPAHTALLVVDMQNDFCAPGGYVERVIGKDVSACSAVAPGIGKLIEHARQHAVEVIWLRACYETTYLSAPMRAKLQEQNITDLCCERGTWGYAWYRDEPHPDELVLDKYCYDGFVGTTLAEDLHKRGIQTLIFAGVQTNICIESTLRHAHSLGFYCVVPQDCVASHTEPAHQATLNNVRFLLGDVTTREDIAGIWQHSDTSRAVYLNYSQADLDRAYDQRAWVDNREELLAWYANESARTRAEFTHHLNIAYGSDQHEVMDIFPAAGGDAPVHVHIHGGGWRNLSKNDESFLARLFVPARSVLIVLDFSLIPDVRIPDMVAQIRQAIAWVHKEVHRYGGDPCNIHISGHSSGAHLAGVIATTDWRAFKLPPDIIKSALLISGMYDLHPVMLSARSSYVTLLKEEQVRYSPIHHIEQLACPVLVAYGEHESPEFKRQSQAFANAVNIYGKHAELQCIANVNHYEIITFLADNNNPLARSALRLMGIDS